MRSPETKVVLLVGNLNFGSWVKYGERAVAEQTHLPQQYLK